MDISAESRAVAAALKAPFSTDEIKWLPKNVKDGRCLALPYLDARAVEDRLDDVFGIDGWQDSYFALTDGSMLCTLRCFINGQWIEKSDSGSPSEQPDAGDRTKAACSDALKRAAVKFGIGRFLYKMKKIWADFDPASKQVIKASLPAWAHQKPLSGNEVAALRELIVLTDSDEDKLCKHYRVEQLEQLDRADFNAAIATLTVRRSTANNKPAATGAKAS